MSIYNLRPYIGNIPQLGGYNHGPYIISPLWKQFGASAFWNFGDGSKFVEGDTATTAGGWDDSEVSVPYDLTQTTAAAQPTWVEDVNDNSKSHLLFGGTQFLEGMPTQSGDFTYIFSVSTDDQIDNKIILGSSISTFPNIKIASNGTLEYRTDNGVSTLSSSRLDDGQRYTIAVTREGTTVRGFIDGTPDLSATNAGDFLVDWIGTRTGISQTFTGKLYDIQIYGSALSAAEIKAATAELN